MQRTCARVCSHVCVCVCADTFGHITALASARLMFMHSSVLCMRAHTLNTLQITQYDVMVPIWSAPWTRVDRDAYCIQDFVRCTYGLRGCTVQSVVDVCANSFCRTSERPSCPDIVSKGARESSFRRGCHCWRVLRSWGMHTHELLTVADAHYCVMFLRRTTAAAEAAVIPSTEKANATL